MDEGLRRLERMVLWGMLAMVLIQGALVAWFWVQLGLIPW